MGSHCGRPVTDPEKAWYHWDGNKTEAGFIVQASGGRHVTLMQFFLPRDWTELVPDTNHQTGKQLQIKDFFRDYARVEGMDCGEYIKHWPRTREDLKRIYKDATEAEFDRHQRVLLSGWARLISAWLNESVPRILNQLPLWEEYLTEEMQDFHWLHRQIKTDGIRQVLSSPRDAKNFRQWLKTAACTVELLYNVCPVFAGILRIDQGINYPCLWAGWQEALKHMERS